MVKSYRSAIVDEPELSFEARPCCVEFITLKECTQGDRIVKQSVFDVDDSRTRHDGLTVDDFSLDNQLNCGVSLNPAFCELSRMPMADRISYEVERFNEFVKSKK